MTTWTRRHAATIANGTATQPNSAEERPPSAAAGEHKWNECSEGATPKCANCGKGHTSRDLNCEARTQGLKRAKDFAYSGSLAAAKTQAKSSAQARDKTVPNDKEGTGLLPGNLVKAAATHAPHPSGT